MIFGTLCKFAVWEFGALDKHHEQAPDTLDVTKSHSKHQPAFVFVVGNPSVQGSDCNVCNGLNGWVRERNANNDTQNQNFFGVLAPT